MAYGKPAGTSGCGPVIIIPTVGLFFVTPLAYGLVKLLAWLMQ
jgi:hypothetical protein